MSARPTAAPAYFPYNHRTVAQVDADRARDLRNQVRVEIDRKRNPARYEPLPNWDRPEWVDREPCFVCGARKDAGCGHRRAA